MNRTTRTFSLPDSHLIALEQEAAFTGMSVDQTMAQAIRVYQMANAKARAGLRMAFVDATGAVVQEATHGLPAFD